MERRARTVLAGIAAALLALLAWLVSGLAPGSDRSPPNRGAAPDGAVAAETTRTAPEPAGPVRSQPSPAPARAPRNDSAEIENTASPPSAPHGDFEGLFIAPDGRERSVARARVVLAGSRGWRREVEVADASRFTVRRVERDRIEVSVEAQGLVHRPQRFDLRAGDEEANPARLYLWPEAFVAVVVRTPDGRPFVELATELSLAPKPLLVGAFDALARRAEPPELASAGEPDLVRFHPPPRYQSWELPGSAVGSLELLAEPPMWIRLDLLGRPLGWRPLARGEREITFTLDSAEIESRLSALTLRVVDRAGTPVAGARATLKADVSAHRRADQQGLAPAVDGGLAFESVVPGRYVLELVSENALREIRLELAPGERRDLGDVELMASAPVELRIVDELGRPAAAWIEVAEHVPGERIDRLYPPNLHRHTTEPGRFELPLPSVRSVVLATPFTPDPQGRFHPDHRRRSRSVLIDPRSPPTGPITLVVGPPAELELDVRAAGAVTVRDELDLVLFAEHVEEPRKIVALVPPGPCVVQRAATDGDPAFEHRLVLAAGPTSVEIR